MIHLEWPWMALLLPIPWLHYALRAAAEPAGATLFMPMALEVIPRRVDTRAAPRLHWLCGLIWVLLVLAAMRPQWLGDPLPLPTAGRRLMLAVDVSGSMAIQDMAGGESRLRVVQEVAGDFIDGRKGDKVGLILFGTQPYLQAPLSPDLATVHRFLDEAVVGVAGTETAIGDAIGLAIKRLRAEAQSAAARRTLLVLLTDGQNDAGAMPPLEAARLAAKEGLKIYTIGVGSTGGGGLFGLGAGNTDLDEETLKAIARTTGGQYFRAGDAAALQAVYEQIDHLEPTAGQQQWLRTVDEWFTWPLGTALLLSLPLAYRGSRTWT